MQRMAARVFAALLASDAGALTSAELGEQLQISPAAVSGAVRYLAQVHMVGARARARARGATATACTTTVWYEALPDRDQILTRWEARCARARRPRPRHPGGAAGSETRRFFEFMQRRAAQA